MLLVTCEVCRATVEMGVATYEAAPAGRLTVEMGGVVGVTTDEVGRATVEMGVATYEVGRLTVEMGVVATDEVGKATCEMGGVLGVVTGEVGGSIIAAEVVDALADETTPTWAGDAVSLRLNLGTAGLVEMGVWSVVTGVRVLADPVPFTKSTGVPCAFSSAGLMGLALAMPPPSDVGGADTMPSGLVIT